MENINIKSTQYQYQSINIKFLDFIHLTQATYSAVFGLQVLFIFEDFSVRILEGTFLDVLQALRYRGTTIVINNYNDLLSL